MLRTRTPNRQFGRLHAVVFGVVIVLFGALGYWQAFRTDLATNENNPRLIAAITSPNRGSILDRDGNVLASSADDGTRIYADASLAHVLGYISPQFGAQGVERAFNDLLNGEPGQTWRDAVNAEFARDDERGLDVQLTIDPAIQAAAASALGERRGAVVAIDPATGEVLAMVSYPAYDPAQVAEGDDSLFDDPSAPLLNRATQGLYSPGSTFKTVTAISLFQNGVIEPGTTVTCEDEVIIDGFPVSCANVIQGPGTYPFADAFTYSVNAMFAEQGVALGWERLTATARELGFDGSLPFTLDTASTQLHGPDSELTDPLLASTAFGQGELLATPLQMAVIAAAVANEGVIETPHLGLQALRDGEQAANLAPGNARRVMDAGVAEIMRQLMGSVVGQGQADMGPATGLPVGGKTGTAETGGDTSHAWFIGFAPLDDPEIAVAVVVEEGGQGGSVAAPIAGAVMQAALSD